MSEHDNSGRSRMPPDAARAWLTAIAESTDDAIVGKNLHGIIISWNYGAAAMFGHTQDEAIGQPITLIIPPERMDEEASILARVHRGERLVHFETERRRKDGTIFPVSLTISPIRDDQGGVVGVSKIARDLSDAHRTHQETQRREALLSSILANVPDALIVIDELGRIQSFSSAAERLFGYSSAEIRHRNVSALMPSPYREQHDAYLSRYLTTGERRIIGIGRVVAGMRRDGTTFPMELTVGTVDLPGEKLFTGFIRDLTERQDRERRMHELQSELIHVARLNELGQLVSALAHEVNQPLAAMANYINGARRLFASGNQAGGQAAIERVAEQAERARQIIRRLRELAKKGDSDMQPESVLVTIEEASTLALAGGGQGLRFQIDVAEDAARAVIDKIQIQQVLLNLMRNAIEAMTGAPRRTLSVNAKRLGNRIEISVTDSGPGLPEQVRSRLFEPFVTTKPEGMGVGLSISRAIVDAHGGQLQADDAPGGGTVFRFTVARAEDCLTAETVA